MLSNQEILRLQATLEALPRTLEFTFYRAGESDFGRRLESFVDHTCAVSRGRIEVRKSPAPADMPAAPCFRIPAEDGTSLVYAAIPERHQFAPFLKALDAFAQGGAAASAAPGRLRSHAEIWVLVSPDCPRCPTAVEAAAVLAGREQSFSLLVIDAQQFPALAAARGIRAVPTTVIDRSLVLVGAVSSGRLSELIGIRGTAEFNDEVFRSLVERGRITEAAECLGEGKGRTPILSLLQEPDLSKRMGALVVLDKALETAPPAVRIMVPSLLELLSHDDARIRGDIADLLGRIGDERAIPHLVRLSADPDSDVAEAAAEALALMRSGNQEL